MKMIRKTAVFAALCVMLTGCGPTYTGGWPVPDETDASSGTAPESSEADAEAAYIWYIEPYLEADDVNAVGEENGLYNYGYHMETPYSVVEKDGLRGLINTDGNVQIAPEFKSVRGELDSADAHYSFSNMQQLEDDKLFCVKSNTVLTVMDRTCNACGTQLSTCAGGAGYCYDPALQQTFQNEPETLHIEPAGTEVHLMAQFTFESVSPQEPVVARSFSMPENYQNPDVETAAVLNEGFAIVKQNQPVTDFEYDCATDFKDGLAAFCKDGKWGYLDAEGKTVIPFAYDADFRWQFGYTYEYEYQGVTESTEIEEFCLPYLPSEGYLALNQGDQAGYADVNGNMIVPVGTFAAARPVHDSLAWVQDDSGLWGVISFDLSRKPAEKPASGLEPVQDSEPAQETEPAEESSETEQAADADGWREAYAEVLRNAGQSHFGLVYVDDNDIPELVVHRGSKDDIFHANTDIELYTYYNGKAVDLGQHSADGYSQFMYAERQGLVLSSWIQMGYIITSYLRLENGEIKVERSMYTDEASAEGVDNPTYKVDDVQVSKEEYDAAFVPYNNIQLSLDNGDYDTTEANIQAYILG